MKEAGEQLFREKLEVLADSDLDRANSVFWQWRWPTTSRYASVGAQPGGQGSGLSSWLHIAPGILPMLFISSRTKKMLNSVPAEGHQVIWWWGKLRERGLYSLG